MSRVTTLAELREGYDLAIVGAGPAGMTAALGAAELGLRVAVFDMKPEPGGQIYAAAGRADAQRLALLGPDYAAGAALVQRFLGAGVDYLPRAQVWGLEQGRALLVSAGGKSRRIACAHVILATGATERPMAVEGWTLPGVMALGGAQLALKTAGLVPKGAQTVLAGSGPLLWLFAAQMIAAGEVPALVLSTTEPPRALSGLLPFLGSSYATKGVGLMARVLARSRVRRARNLRIASGPEGLEVSYATPSGQSVTVAARHVFLHDGIAPNLALAQAAGLALRWNDRVACREPACDGDGRSSDPRVTLAGDGAGIAGVAAARLAGELAALDAARALGRTVPESRARSLRAGLAREASARRFLDTLYRPADWLRQGAEAALVCRCEEVTGREVRDTTRALEVPGSNALKGHLRCGMGPCQGRYCGLTVAEIIAAERGVSPAEVAPLGLRPPVGGVRLAELATLAEEA